MLSPADRERVKKIVQDFQAQALDIFDRASELLITEAELELKLEQILKGQRQQLTKATTNLDKALLAQVLEEFINQYYRTVKERAKAKLKLKLEAYLEQRQAQLEQMIEALCDDVLTEFKTQVGQRDQAFLAEQKHKLKEIISGASASLQLGKDHTKKSKNRPDTNDGWVPGKLGGSGLPW